ncbi:DUF2190 family protein [Salinimonas marina]|uniref:DUF2190 family protein n=1 Tax=Salinimonas marina TaxID=2785918 RepID=A0A7S9DYZ9_9ALTE|nr:capsid cement protein [Salinimonas marina]QPG06554.1 DUF2190 family protein [Salinimonas marina]
MSNAGLVKTFIAATAIPRFTVVCTSAGDNQVEMANAVTDPLIGVSVEPADVPVGARVDVAFSGIVEVKAGAAIAKMAWLTVNAQGEVVTSGVESDERIGRALQAANAAGDIIEIEIIKQ